MWFISATFNELISHFSQESLLCLGLLILLLASVFPSITRDHISFYLGGLVISCMVLSTSFTPSYQSLILSSTATCGFKFIVSLAFLWALTLDFFCSRASKGTLVLMGLSLLPMFLLFSANDWMFLFLAFESLALSSYCLIAMPGTRRALEGTLKYFAAGAISTCLLLLGIFIFFFSCEHTAFSRLPLEGAPALAITVFCASAFILKVGCAPFHYWVVDSYEGAPATVMVFLATTVKLCMFFLLAKILYGPLFAGAMIWSPILSICAGASIILGCFGAIFQQNFKRLLAYSSINNVGYAVGALSIGNIGGIQASIVYMAFYASALLLLFSLTFCINNGRPAVQVTDLKKLRESPAAAVLATFCLFSLAGIPPLSGFWIKFFVLSELVNAKFYTLAAIGAFGSIISSYYYVNIIKLYYFESFKEVYSNSIKILASKDRSTSSFVASLISIGNLFFKPLPTKVPNVFVVILAFSLIAYPLFPEIVHELSGSLAVAILTEFR